MKILKILGVPAQRKREHNQSHRWPRPHYDPKVQPHFLFIITPPNSGSTVLSGLLNTGHRTMVLQERGEGQWLIPGLCEGDRWEADKAIDYDSIKAVWLNRYQFVKKLVHHVDVVIEKSPPNMMRMEKIATLFADYSFIANNRDPYANCASILYRLHDADSLPSGKRKGILGALAGQWLMRSRVIRDLTLKLHAPLITYESFCRSPASLLPMLKVPPGVVDSINLEAEVKVKDYRSQGVANQNQRQLALLTAEEKELLYQILRPEEELLAFFNYRTAPAP